VGGISSNRNVSTKGERRPDSRPREKSSSLDANIKRCSEERSSRYPVRPPARSPNERRRQVIASQYGQLVATVPLNSTHDIGHSNSTTITSRYFDLACFEDANEHGGPRGTGMNRDGGKRTVAQSLDDLR
jgi:hypothetical protein